MITKEELARERAKAVAISNDQILTPNIPVVDFLQDTADLIPIYEQDKPELKKVNMDFSIGDRLEPAILSVARRANQLDGRAQRC